VLQREISRVPSVKNDGDRAFVEISRAREARFLST